VPCEETQIKICRLISAYAVDTKAFFCLKVTTVQVWAGIRSIMLHIRYAAKTIMGCAC